MKWKQYQIIFSLKSPLHIGYRKIGNLMQTRKYVHGKIIWAALTARLTRDCGRGADGMAYKKIGDAVKRNFRFGYLWPAVPADNVTRVKNWDDVETFFSYDVDDKNVKYLKDLFPHPKLNDTPPFDYLFLDSYASTALSAHVYSSEEGSLHDTEFLAPYTRDLRQVFLTGSLWVLNNLPESLEDWEAKLRYVRFGGEESYGWGRVQLMYCASGVSIDPDCFPWSGPIPAHVEVMNSGEIIQGCIEPLVGWETKSSGIQKVGSATIAYVPGSSTKNGVLNFAIGESGIWTL